MNAGGVIIGSIVNTRFVHRINPGAILRLATVIACLINLVGLGLIMAGITGWPTLVQFFLFQARMGFIGGNAIALAQGRARKRLAPARR